MTSLFVTVLRPILMQEGSCELLKQNGSLGFEFKRTGNSLLYFVLTDLGKLRTAFADGVLGMSAEYKKLLRLSGHSHKNIEAFKLHLALHDAGKGDRIKNAVHRDKGGNYYVKLPSGNYYKVAENQITPAQAPQFSEAEEYVDHDVALELYGIVGAREGNCTSTEYLLWEGPAPSEAKTSKDTFILCDELMSLCNEMNIAQIVQGEIPFAGIKKGLNLFFDAYKKDPQLAELVFVHHCFDIFGAKPSDTMVSAAGSSPHIHLKINLLYKVLVAVAQNLNPGKEPAEVAYALYRQELAKAIPDILASGDSSHDMPITHIAQMLRCHLFKTVTDPENQSLTVNENGQFDSRTSLFVEGIDAAFHQLPRGKRQKLVAYLNNISTQDTPAVMVGYGPELLLTATTGAVDAKADPTEKAQIAERLSPMLQLYVNLYELQLQKSAEYSVIHVNNLALIIEQVFTWYKDADKNQKKNFADLLFELQKQGKAKAFLEELGSVKDKTASEQMNKLDECIRALELHLVINKNKTSPPHVNYEKVLRRTPIRILYRELKNDTNVDEIEKK